MDSSDTENNDELLFTSSATLYYNCFKRKKCRFTAHALCREREREGDYMKLFHTLKTDKDESKFFSDMRMSKSTFKYILGRMEKYDAEQKYHNCHGRPIMMEQRLVLTIQ
jgi:hypothetical protein